MVIDIIDPISVYIGGTGESGDDGGIIGIPEVGDSITILVAAGVNGLTTILFRVGYPVIVRVGIEGISDSILIIISIEKVVRDVSGALALSFIILVVSIAVGVFIFGENTVSIIICVAEVQLIQSVGILKSRIRTGFVSGSTEGYIVKSIRQTVPVRVDEVSFVCDSVGVIIPVSKPIIVGIISFHDIQNIVIVRVQIEVVLQVQSISIDRYDEGTPIVRIKSIINAIPICIYIGRSDVGSGSLTFDDVRYTITITVYVYIVFDSIAIRVRIGEG